MINETEIVALKEMIEYNKKAIEYNTKLLEDITLRIGDNKGAKTMVHNQMDMLKKMFSGLPIDPELKKGINNIFDQAGGQI